MSELLQRLEAEALNLPPEERESLAATLIQSLDDGPLNEIDAAWIAEAERRSGAIDRGEEKLISGEQFFRDLRRELGCE